MYQSELFPRENNPDSVFYGETALCRSIKQNCWRGLGSNARDKKKNRSTVTVKIDKFETRMSLEVSAKLWNHCVSEFKRNGVPMGDTLERVISCGLQ